MNETDASLKSKAPGPAPGGVVQIRRALISVWDKAGVIDLAAALHQMGVGILSTGGTAQALREAEIPVTTVESITGYPAILDGRVKTLHPAIFAAILGKDDAAHRAQLDEMGITPVDLVVVNLYPFESRALDAPLTEVVELIDIGGVSLLRAAAKNWERVAVVCDPAQYAPVIAEMREGGGMSEETRRTLAAAAFNRTAAYDSVIARAFAPPDQPFPERVTLAFEKIAGVRYGENPHQRAAFYRDPQPAPGTLALLARKGNLRILECAAPSGQATSLMSLRGAERRSNLLIGIEIRSVSGGLLVQGHDTTDLDESRLRVATPRAPSDEEMADLRFAWKVCKWVKSNAIVLAYGGATVGIGSGQPNRVGAVEIAVKGAGDRARGAVLASDAFFPFRDGIDAAAQAGITAIIQPGGSVRDEEVIAAATEHGLAMVFTGMRHFRH